MKRIIRLTESDLTRIVKRVINEQLIGPSGGYTDPYNKAAEIHWNNKTLKNRIRVDSEMKNVTSGDELRLPKFTTFRKVGDQLVAKNQPIELVGDFFGTSSGSESGKTIRIGCTPSGGYYNVTVDGMKHTWYGEDWSKWWNLAVKDACAKFK